LPDVFILFHQWAIYSNRMWNLVNFLVQIIWHYLFTGKSLYLQDQNIFYSIEIYRPCIYRKIPVNTGKMCFIAFVLKTTGSCKIFLYLQDPVITEPCIFIALGSELIRNLWQLRTAVFLHWCLIRAVPFFHFSKQWSMARNREFLMKRKNQYD